MNELTQGHGRALARAALAGNPSDGYGGAVLAVTLKSCCAEVYAVRGPMPGSPAVLPPNQFVAATARRFAREIDQGALECQIEWGTTIPRSVGLGGSSAIVLATTRALCELCGVELYPGVLADFALAVERDDLGIAAGPQDRVAQAYEGLTFMEFAATGDGRAHYEALDPRLLPELLIAWRLDAATGSGAVHEQLRERYAAGDKLVAAAMTDLADAARQARAALLAGERASFCACMDRTIEARGRIVTLERQCVEMIEAARAAGAAANYTGSGGAIVAACPDAGGLGSVSGALDTLGCRTARMRWQ